MKTIHLQSIGEKYATEAKNLKPGDVLIWNHGGRESVGNITPTKTGKSLNVQIKYRDFHGKEVVSNRRLGANTLVATEKLNPGTRDWTK